VTEADEPYQNAGEKGRKHTDPLDPPRRRANQARGHGTWATDRPPIVGIVGRRSGHIRLRVCKHADRATLEPLVVAHTRPDAIVNTDEWAPYQHLAAIGRRHQTVCHAPERREWARDEDGDGVREVHNNTMEGIWTGCRNFLRLFRGVSKWFLARYVAAFECAHNLKWVTPTLVRAMMTRPPLNQHEPEVIRTLVYRAIQPHRDGPLVYSRSGPILLSWTTPIRFLGKSTERFSRTGPLSDLPSPAPTTIRHS